MKHFGYFLLPVLFFAFVSCQNDEKKVKTDSSSVAIPGFAQMQKTDSGRLEIKTNPGEQESSATLYSENGKVLQKGKLVNNQPAGAWIKYDSSGNVIAAARYSGGKRVEELDPEDFRFTKCDRPALKASFSVPQKWKETAMDENVALFFKNQHDTLVLNPNFNFRHEKLQPGDDLEKLGQMQLQVLHENVGRVDMVNQADVIIDSCKALRRYGMFTDERGTTGFLNAIIISGNDVWFFSAEAPNNKDGEFLKYQGVFQSVLESFRRK